MAIKTSNLAETEKVGIVYKYNIIKIVFIDPLNYVLKNLEFDSFRDHVLKLIQ